MEICVHTLNKENHVNSATLKKTHKNNISITVDIRSLISTYSTITTGGCKKNPKPRLRVNETVGKFSGFKMKSYLLFLLRLKNVSKRIDATKSPAMWIWILKVHCILEWSWKSRNQTIIYSYIYASMCADDAVLKRWPTCCCCWFLFQ